MKFDIISYFVMVTMIVGIFSSTVFLQQGYSAAKLCNDNSHGYCVNNHHQQIHSIASRKGSLKHKQPFIFPIPFP
jgi:hypothetical protein